MAPTGRKPRPPAELANPAGVYLRFQLKRIRQLDRARSREHLSRTAWCEQVVFAELDRLTAERTATRKARSTAATNQPTNQTTNEEETA